MERELLDEDVEGMEPLVVVGGTGSVRASPPERPSKSKVASPVGVRGLLGVEQEPMRRAAFSSSLFFRQAALGFR